MQGAIHSINGSGSGGVPKVSVKATMVNFEGLEGDYNRFRTERRQAIRVELFASSLLSESGSCSEKVTQ